MREDGSGCTGINLWGEVHGSPGFLGMTGGTKNRDKGDNKMTSFFIFFKMGV